MKNSLSSAILIPCGGINGAIWSGVSVQGRRKLSLSSAFASCGDKMATCDSDLDGEVMEIVNCASEGLGVEVPTFVWELLLVEICG